MAENKKAVILYVDIISTFENLSDEEAGRLIKHYLRYVNDMNPEPPDRITQIAFEPIKQQLKRDLVKWECEREERVKAGKLGGLKSGEARRTKLKQTQANEASALKSKQTQANEAVNVTVNVNDTVTSANADFGQPQKQKRKKTEVTPEFERFWQIYPNKKSKKAAFEAWQKMNIDTEMIEKIIKSVNIQLKSHDWTKDGGQYIPHPATWLNGERWNDETQMPQSEQHAIKR